MVVMSVRWDGTWLRSLLRLMLWHVPLIDAEQRVREPLETQVLLGRLIRWRGLR